MDRQVLVTVTKMHLVSITECSHLVTVSKFKQFLVTVTKSI